MEDLIKILVSKDNWLALWLAYMVYENWQLKKQSADYHRTLVVIATNSTTAIMALTEVLKNEKERAWGERFDNDFEVAKERAALKLKKDHSPFTLE